MTLTATDKKVRYAGNGATVSFPVTFPFWDSTDLSVVLTSAAGVETAWVENTQYAITGGDGSTGTLTVDTSPTDYTPASGTFLTITSAVPFTQPTSLPVGGAFPAASVEEQMDKIVRMVQQLDEAVDRSVKFPVSDSTALSSELPVAASRVSKAFVFDADGEPGVVDVADLGDGVVSDTAPLALGAASAGTSDDVSRNDHVHPTTGLVLEANNGSDFSNTQTAFNTLAAFDGTPNSDLTANGPTTNTFVAAGSSTVGDLVYLNSSSKWVSTDADAVATAGGVPLGLSLETKSADQAMKVALPGCFVRNDAWSWTPGAPLYVSETAAEISASVPSGVDGVVRVVGFAVTAEVIFFNPSDEYVTIDANGKIKNVSGIGLDANLDNLAALTPVAGRYIGYDTNGAEAVVRGVMGGAGHTTNRYYPGFLSTYSGTQNGAMTADRLYGRLFIVTDRATFTRIGVEVVTGAGTSARLGVYALDGTALASSALLVDAGTVSTSATALVDATISLTLMPGVYIVAAVFDNTPTMRAGPPNVSITEHYLGAASTDIGAGSGGVAWFYTAHVFGALPSTFGTPTYVGSASNPPNIWLRVV